MIDTYNEQTAYWTLQYGEEVVEEVNKVVLDVVVKFKSTRCPRATNRA